MTMNRRDGMGESETPRSARERDGAEPRSSRGERRHGTDKCASALTLLEMLFGRQIRRPIVFLG